MAATLTASVRLLDGAMIDDADVILTMSRAESA